ncbi:MAG: lysine--tRNA ligase [Rickettsiales bacterium]|jgi:lysyl-tRNA synthetase class 2|nr:lysine--tRNA ligase [Rickettsiales bacterium]
MSEKNVVINESEARLQKVESIRATDGVVWKDKFLRTNTIAEARLMSDGEKLKTAGRLVAARWMGGLMFGKIYDIGGEIQVSFSANDIGQDKFDWLHNNLDLGDFIGLDGEIYHTTRGELTVKGFEYKILSKALRGLPDKHHGLVDVETRYRQRYLDMISNSEVRDVMKLRFAMMKFIREFLGKNNFVEIETPILQNIASGAAAKPFITHHNALDADFYLRIAPELYLKQAVAAGFDRVFEMGKNFRNEGIDPTHLQEFTMLEWYAAYWDWSDNVEFSISLIQEMLLTLNGTLKIKYQDAELDFSKFARMDYIAELSKIFGQDILSLSDLAAAKKVLLDKGLFKEFELKEIKSVMGLVDFVFKKKIRANTIQPTIVYNYPAYMKPLARRSDKDARASDVFQLVVAGAEMINAYSELVDPLQQRAAFAEQMDNKAAGEEEGVELDEDYIRAMEHGMPPVSGLGLGIDRWVMLLTDQPSVRDVILFPLMK